MIARPPTSEHGSDGSSGGRSPLLWPSKRGLLQFRRGSWLRGGRHHGDDRQGRRHLATGAQPAHRMPQPVPNSRPTVLGFKDDDLMATTNKDGVVFGGSGSSRIRWAGAERVRAPRLSTRTLLGGASPVALPRVGARGLSPPLAEGVSRPSTLNVNPPRGGFSGGSPSGRPGLPHDFCGLSMLTMRSKQ